MCAVAGALGAHAVRSVTVAGGFVVETFGRALMSISHARAAGADFAVMQAALACHRAAAAAAVVAWERARMKAPEGWGALDAAAAEVAE